MVALDICEFDETGCNYQLGVFVFVKDIQCAAKGATEDRRVL